MAKAVISTSMAMQLQCSWHEMLALVRFLAQQGKKVIALRDVIAEADGSSPLV